MPDSGDSNAPMHDNSASSARAVLPPISSSPSAVPRPCRDIRTQIGPGAIAGVHQDHPARKAGLTRPAQLFERNLWLGLEADLLRNTRLAPTFAILCPRAIINQNVAREAQASMISEDGRRR
jgi:hypothetical protein